jgi:predicted helicase
LDTARAAYGASVTREDVFYATYALLHHPAYRARYGENLKRELPRLPLGSDAVAPAIWSELVRLGRALGDLHVGYETAAPHLFSHQNITPKGVAFSLRVEKMRWQEGKTQLRVNDCLVLSVSRPRCSVTNSQSQRARLGGGKLSCQGRRAQWPHERPESRR